jgi:hypothetical protein
MSVFFETDQAAARNRRMWLKIGKIFERVALKLAAEPLSRKTAVELAQLAEGCFWQATGENDSFELPQTRPATPSLNIMEEGGER